MDLTESAFETLLWCVALVGIMIIAGWAYINAPRDGICESYPTANATVDYDCGPLAFLTTPVQASADSHWQCVQECVAYNKIHCHDMLPKNITYGCCVC